MIDKIEISDVKKIRKTLLISSFIGIAFKELVKYSTGNIEFFGFKIPVSDADIVPKLVGYLIIYFVIALLIKYNNEDLNQRYLDHIDLIKMEGDGLQKRVKQTRRDFTKGSIHFRTIINLQIMFRRFGGLLIDIIFPISFALFTLSKIFYD